jgi:hypothetical protein
MTPEESKKKHEEYLKKKSKGLGDTVAKITKAVGLKPCGACKKRQKKLNRLFPYKEDPNVES